MQPYDRRRKSLHFVRLDLNALAYGEKQPAMLRRHSIGNRNDGSFPSKTPPSSHHNRELEAATTNKIRKDRMRFDFLNMHHDSLQRVGLQSTRLSPEKIHRDNAVWRIFLPDLRQHIDKHALIVPCFSDLFLRFRAIRRCSSG